MKSLTPEPFGFDLAATYASAMDEAKATLKSLMEVIVCLPRRRRRCMKPR